MTNLELIKSMNDDTLANFINITRPNCNDLCKDAKSGCAFSCKHNCGKNIIKKWLNEEAY